MWKIVTGTWTYWYSAGQLHSSFSDK